MAAFDSAKPRSAAQRAFLLGVGSRVATLRGQGGWSQEELAERAGINVQTLSRLERHMRENKKSRRLPHTKGKRRPTAVALFSFPNAGGLVVSNQTVCLRLKRDHTP